MILTSAHQGLNVAISHAAEASSLTTFTGGSNNRSQSLRSKNIRDDRYIIGQPHMQYRGPLIWKLHCYFCLKTIAWLKTTHEIWQNIYSVNGILFISFHCLYYNYESRYLQRSQLFRSSKCVLCKCRCVFKRIMEKMRLTK